MDAKTAYAIWPNGDVDFLCYAEIAVNNGASDDYLIFRSNKTLGQVERIAPVINAYMGVPQPSEN